MKCFLVALLCFVELSCFSNDDLLDESSQKRGRTIPPFRGIMKFHPFRMEVATCEELPDHLEFALNFRLESIPIDVGFSWMFMVSS